MHSNMLKRVRIAAAPFLVTLLVLGLASTAQAGGRWHVGDVFVCIGKGTCNVVRPGTAPNTTLLDQISDGLSGAGATGGATINNTLHFLVTDAGATNPNTGNVGSNIVEYTIAGVDPSGNPIAHTPVNTFDASNGGTSSNIQSIALDVHGDMFAANATPATIVELSPAGGFVSSFNVASCIDTQLASIDLDAAGSAVYFTSLGSTIQKLTLNSSSCAPLIDFGKGITLFDIRVIPPNTNCGAGCPIPASGGFLVVAQGKTGGINICTGTSGNTPGSCVLLLDNTGAIQKRYIISTPTVQNNLQVLTLDPIVTDCRGGQCSSLPLPSATLNNFWVAAPDSANLFRVNIDSGAAARFNAVKGIQSLATYGGESAAQPGLTELFSGFVSQQTPTQVVQFPLPLSVADTNTMTVTVYNPPNGNTPMALYASEIDPLSGADDSGLLPCTQTTSTSECIVWKFDIDLPLAPTSTILSAKFKAPIGVNNNTHVFLDEFYDVTNFTGNLDPGGGRSSVHSLNQVPGTDEGCSYFSPVTEGACFNNPGNITFRFTCSALNSTQLAALQPAISIVQTFPNQTPVPAPLPVTPLFTGGTTDFRFGSNSWIFNWAVSGEGDFRACTFDLTKTAQSFCVDFTVSSSCPSAPTVSSVTPNSGSVTGGTNVTIAGNGFLSGATVAFAGGAATNVVVVSKKKITATTPPFAAGGSVNVVVTNPDLSSGTLVNGFTYTTP